MGWKTTLGAVALVGVAGYIVYSYVSKNIGDALALTKTPPAVTPAEGNNFSSSWGAPGTIPTPNDIISNTAPLTDVIGGLLSNQHAIKPSEAQVPVTVLPGGEITLPSGRVISSNTPTQTATQGRSEALIPGSITDAFGRSLSVQLPNVPGVSYGGNITPAQGVDIIVNAYGTKIDPYAQVGSPVWNKQHGIPG